MSQPRLLLDNCTQISSERWLVDKLQSHHILNVLRCQHGDTLIGLTSGVKNTLLLDLTDGKCMVALKKSRLQQEDARRITVILPLLKSDQFDLSLRICTELGVSSILLVSCNRSVPMIRSENRVDKMRRWNKILEQAALQCGTVHFPKLYPPVKLQELDYASLPQARYVAMIDAQAQMLGGVTPSDEIIFAIGPEGGWDQEEECLFKEKKFVPTHLGYRVLRASTALAVLCGWLRYSA